MLGEALRRRDWERAALYLLLGLVQVVGSPSNPRRRRRSFYEEALSAAERLELEEARRLEGLDEEIALLRLKLKRALEEEPQNLGLIVKGLELLVRAVSAHYRLSREDEEGLAQGLRAVLREIGARLYPEGFSDA